MVIGGQAILLYGEPRLTRDIDITLGINVDELKSYSSVNTALGSSSVSSGVMGKCRESNSPIS